MADAAELRLSLQLPTDNYREIIYERIKKAIWPIGYAANMLHHKYKGNLLDEEQRNIDNNFIEKYFSDTAKRELETFLETREDYNIYSENCKDPIAFWNFVGWNLPNLSQHVTRIMLMPASTALIESFFYTGLTSIIVTGIAF